MRLGGVGPETRQAVRVHPCPKDPILMSRSPPPSRPAPERLISTKLGAQRLNISTNALRQLIADGRLTGYTIGRLVKVDAAEIERFILANASDA